MIMEDEVLEMPNTAEEAQVEHLYIIILVLFNKRAGVFYQAKAKPRDLNLIKTRLRVF